MRQTPTRRYLRLEALLSAAGIPCAVAHHDPQAIVFSQGDPCDSVMYLEAGRVRLEVLSPGGAKAVCGLLEAGAFLGDEALAGRPARRHTAIAMCDTEVLVVGKADMVRALHTLPEASDLFMAHALAQASDLQADLADQLLHSGAQRLARVLVRLSDGLGQTRGRRQVPRMSQEVIAEMIGTTRSRVNTLLATFRRRGLVEACGGSLYVTPLLHEWVETSAPSARRHSVGAARSTTVGRPPVGGTPVALR